MTDATPEGITTETWHKHLEFIQNAVIRMTQNSYLLKGWTVTLVAATFAVSLSVTSVWLVGSALFPTIAFSILDASYLRQERLFRRLYDDVRRDRNKVEPFSLDIQPYKHRVQTTARIMVSTSILPFYGSIALIIVLAVIARLLSST
jgi:hypothetical protein